MMSRPEQRQVLKFQLLASPTPIFVKQPIVTLSDRVFCSEFVERRGNSIMQSLPLTILHQIIILRHDRSALFRSIL